MKLTSSGESKAIVLCLIKLQLSWFSIHLPSTVTRFESQTQDCQYLNLLERSNSPVHSGTHIRMVATRGILVSFCELVVRT